MNEGVIVAIITGSLTLIGTIITVMVGNSKAIATMDKNQAVTDTKLDALTQEVQKHNNFGSRIPVLETQIEMVSKRVDMLEKSSKKEA